MSSSPSPLSAVLTVGSTSFTPLVHSLFSSRSLSALSQRGITSLLAQVGDSILPPNFSIGTHETNTGLKIVIVKFLSGIEAEVGRAELVISHAGAGSILSFLRSDSNDADLQRRGRQLILVPNSTLMDSHQTDLADEMSSKGWALVADPTSLPSVLESHSSSSSSSQGGSSTEYPAHQPHLINTLLSTTLGFPA